ncbi:reverse transcriptase domain-containing protein [Tanacetum coccineum]
MFSLSERLKADSTIRVNQNTWGKYGLVKSMLNSSTRIFTFQFSYIDGLNAMLENGPWFIRNNPLILKKWDPDVNLLKEDVVNFPLSSYARALIEVRADVELKDNIVVAMPKHVGGGILYVLGYGEDHEEAWLISSSGNKMKDADAEPTIEVSNLNPFDALNSVENDVDLGTNCGTLNLASNKANSGGSSFWNMEASNDEGKPLKKVAYPVDHDSEDEVESVDNDMARCQEIPDKIQSIRDNLDISVRGHKKK